MERGFASRYEELGAWHWWFRGRERILAAALHRSLLEPPRRVLSVGCGPPRHLDWLQRIADPRGLVVGLDLDATGVLRRSGLADRPAARRTMLVADLEVELPLRSGAFDLVVALDVVEHLDDDVTALRRLGALVAPGGLLAVTVPALPWLWGQQDVIAEHRRRYTAGGLRGALRAAGLQPTHLGHFNTILLPPIAAVRLGRRLLPRRAPHSDFDGARPGLANRVLEQVFAAERHVVGRVSLPLGVSLLAMIRR
ncbi:MAG: class I SAM-dependent methyltransferase [Planctomycetes bacterium]|nr:class I SAM-dependent methyltransferase [Planctomycetota bacterium]